METKRACEDMVTRDMERETENRETMREAKEEVNKVSMKEVIKIATESKEITRKPDGNVFSVYTDIVEKDDDDDVAGQPLDIKFDIGSMPKWDGGHQTTKGFEPTLRQFIQRIEDIASVKGWNEAGRLVMLPNMLHDGIKHAYDRWRLSDPRAARSWKATVDWLELQDMATPTRMITNEKLYALKMKPKETIEDYTTRFYVASAGYSEGGDAVLKSIYVNGTIPHLKAYLMTRNNNSLDETIAAARTWSAMQEIKNGGNYQKETKPKSQSNQGRKDTEIMTGEKAKEIARKLAGRKVFTGRCQRKADSMTGKFCYIHKKDTHDTNECKLKPYVVKRNDDHYFIEDGECKKPKETMEIKKEEVNSLTDTLKSMIGLFKTKNELNQVEQKQKVKSKERPKEGLKVKCYHCGGMGHYASKCFRNP